MTNVHIFVEELDDGTYADAKLEFSKLLYVRVESDETFTAHDEMYPLAEMGETLRIATYQLLTVDDVNLILETNKLDQVPPSLLARADEVIE